jgi:hypothetical protein
VHACLAVFAEEALLAEEGADVIDWEELRACWGMRHPGEGRHHRQGLNCALHERTRAFVRVGAYNVLHRKSSVGDGNGRHRAAHEEVQVFRVLVPVRCAVAGWRESRRTGWCEDRARCVGSRRRECWARGGALLHDAHGSLKGEWLELGVDGLLEVLDALLLVLWTEHWALAHGAR